MACVQPRGCAQAVAASVNPGGNRNGTAAAARLGLGVALLPGPAEAAVRAGVDYVVLLAAPRREGLRWIEMGDPRLRKADKLQTSAR